MTTPTTSTTFLLFQFFRALFIFHFYNKMIVFHKEISNTIDKHTVIWHENFELLSEFTIEGLKSYHFEFLCIPWTLLFKCLTECLNGLLCSACLRMVCCMLNWYVILSNRWLIYNYFSKNCRSYTKAIFSSFKIY